MANKKITELPLIQRVSGSVGYGINDLKSVIPIVVAGTTTQMIVEDFSKFVNAYNAHTGSAGNTFKGPQTIQSTLSVTGNASVGGNLVVAGRITAEEFHTEITTASVIYSSGSTKFGDTSNDTHEFTGSIQIGGETLGNAGLNAFSGSFSAQLARVQQATASLQQATSSLQAHSASVNAQLLAIQQTTQSLQVATASIQAQTASLLAFTASQDGRNFTLSQVTGSFRGEIGGLEAYSASLKAAAIVSSSTQVQNYDLFAINSVMYIATGSIKGEIAGIEEYTASLKSQAIVSSSTQIQNYDLFALNSNLYIATGSIKGEIAGLESYSASLKAAAIVSSSTQIQNYDLFALNSNLYIATGSIKGEVAGIEAYTASLKGQAIVSSSTQIQNYDLFALNSNLYTATGSLIGITNGLMAFTASLDNSYATDAQLYQLYQATRSLELLSGSMIGITNGLMAYTASNETWKDGVRGEVNGIESYTSSLKAAAIVSSSTQVQNYDLFALNSNLYTSTGSIKGEIAGLEAYTASLKAAISVSGTNVQIIGDLNVNKLNVQYISSSVLVTSGSNIFGDQSTDKHEFTGSVNINDTLFIKGQAVGLGELNSFSGSLIGITNELMSYTASLKGQAIVSSSQQIKDYIAFVSNDATSSMTASYATMAGLAMSVYTPSGTANRILYQSAGGGSSTTTTDAALVWNSGTGTISATSMAVASTGTFKSALDATNNISMHDGSFGIMAFRNGDVDKITTYRGVGSIVKISGSLLVDSNSATAIHQITGSLNVTGSSHTIQSGYVILQQVSQSLNFVDDTAAAAGGVPLGGLYRNGNFIVIRIV